MTCKGCVRSVIRKLTGVAGVLAAAVDPTGKAVVGYDDSIARVEDLIAAMEQIGFHAARMT